MHILILVKPHFEVVAKVRGEPDATGLKSCLNLDMAYLVFGLGSHRMLKRVLVITTSLNHQPTYLTHVVALGADDTLRHIKAI